MAITNALQLDAAWLFLCYKLRRHATLKVA